MKPFSVLLLISLGSLVLVSGLSKADADAYSKLQDLFDHSKPITLDQLLAQNDPAVKKWNCAGAYPGATDIEVLNVMPVRTQGKVMVTPAQSSAGPAFPGNSEVDKMTDAIVWVNSNGSDATTAIDLRGLDYSLNTQGGLTVTRDGGNYDFIGTNLTYYGGGIIPVVVTQTFQMNQNMLVVKTTTDNDGIAFSYPLIYCYKN
jgi:hypothetical protein